MNENHWLLDRKNTLKNLKKLWHALQKYWFGPLAGNIEILTVAEDCVSLS